MTVWAPLHTQPCATVLTWVFKYSVKAAARGDGGERRPLAVVPSSGRRAGFGAWPADPRLGTFVITRPDEAPLPGELPRLRLPEEPGAKQPPPQEPIKARGYPVADHATAQTSSPLALHCSCHQ